MALTTGILYVKSGQKGKIGQTYQATADADVTSNWSNIETVPGQLLDGTVVVYAALYQQNDPAFPLYAANGNLITTRGTKIDDYGGAPSSINAVEDPGARAVNILYIPAATVDGETVTIGPDIYEIDTNGAVAAGHIAVPVAGTAAVGTLTSDGTQPANNDTTTWNGKVYTFQTVLTNVDGHVLIGASVSATLDNLVAAINLATGAGIIYAAATTLHPTMHATKASGTTVTATANTPGTAGNALTTTAASAHLSFGGATLATGADPTAAASVIALEAAIKASATGGYTAEVTGTNELLISSNFPAAMALATTETLAGAGNVWAAAAMYGGYAAYIFREARSQRVPTATEVTLGDMQFQFDFQPVSVDVKIVMTATPGVAIAWDGAITIVANRVKIDNTGATDWATTNTVIVRARG